MAHAFDELTPGGPVLLMGTDCAVITPAHLVGCADALRHGADAVVVPVEDGGYILIGLRAPAPGLFTAMPWSTSAIMALTRERARSAGLSIVECETLWDIDRPEDYDRAVAEGLL